MRQLFPLALAVALAGCSTTKTDIRNDAEMSKYDPATTARVRLITGDTTKGAFTTGQTCEQFFDNVIKNRPKDPDGLIQAHVHSPGLEPFRASDRQNTVIGMPASKATKIINSTAKVYDEHVVPANKPFIAVFSMGGPSLYCVPKPVVFTPQPGESYELQYQPVGISTFKAGCIVAVRKLIANAAATVETPMTPQICARLPDGTTKAVDPVQGLSEAP